MFERGGGGAKGKPGGMVRNGIRGRGTRDGWMDEEVFKTLLSFLSLLYSCVTKLFTCAFAINAVDGFIYQIDRYMLRRS